MNNFFTNKRLKFLAIFIAILSITAVSYFYIPKFWEPKTSQLQITPTSETKKFEFSHPDNRPDEIKGNIITLKRLRPEYFHDYDKMCTPLVRKPLYFPIHGTYEWMKKFLEKQLRKEAEGKLFVYVVFDNKDNKLIGSVEIREKNPKDPGQFGCWLNENYWGSGRLQEAIKLLTDAYFKIKKADSFNAHVEMWNLRSYYALKKAGFKLVKFYYEDDKPTRYILEFYNPYKQK